MVPLSHLSHFTARVPPCCVFSFALACTPNKRGIGVLPKERLDIQTLCLQRQSPTEKNTYAALSGNFPGASDRSQPVERCADDVILFRSGNLHRHTVADLRPANHQHPATRQFQTGNVVQIALFFGVIQIQIAGVGQRRADGDIPIFINPAAKPLQAAGGGLGRRANTRNSSFHEILPFIEPGAKRANWIALPPNFTGVWSCSDPIG